MKKQEIKTLIYQKYKYNYIIILFISYILKIYKYIIYILLMHNPKVGILKAFTSHLIDLYDDLDRVFPRNVELRNGRTWIELTKKVNPRLLIKGWKEFLNDSYYDKIMNGDVDFFLNKDYNEELKKYKGGANNNDSYREFFEDIKRKYTSMEGENQNKTLKYIQNLCKLADIYHN